MHLPTVARYIEKSIRHPARAVRNGIRVTKFALLNEGVERRKLFAFLAEAFGADTERLESEFESSEFHSWTQSRRRALAEYKGPYRFGSTGVWDCEALYYLVRTLKPRIVVETGVCYGASTSYILEALSRNGGGHLHSIDLGNKPAEPPSDFFVHSSHRDFWSLIIGDSREELPKLLDRLGRIDLFHHDSLHTYEHMTWEFEAAFPHLSPGGAISSDDVNTVLSLRHPFQRPFPDFCARHGWKGETVRNFGLAVCGSPHAARIRSQRQRSPVPRVAEAYT